MDNKKDAQTSQEEKDKLKNAVSDALIVEEEVGGNSLRSTQKNHCGTLERCASIMQEAHDLVFNVLSEEKDSLGGESSIFLLPGLFILTETHIMEGRGKKAEEYLTAAYWNFLKYNKFEEKGEGDKAQNKQAAPAQQSLAKEEYLQYKTNLHRTFSKLYVLKKDYAESINQAQAATYLDCLKYGPEHPTTSLNYFQIGRIFLVQGKVEQAEAFFGKIAEIWYKYLKTYFKKPEEEQERFLVDDIVLEEALESLKFIQKHFEDRYPEKDGQNVFIPVMRTLYSIGLLYKIFNQTDLCRDYLRGVYKQCQMFLPKNDQKTQKVKNELKAMGSEQGSDNEEDHQSESSDTRPREDESPNPRQNG